MASPRFAPKELDGLLALVAEWGKIVSKRAFGDEVGHHIRAGRWSALPHLEPFQNEYLEQASVT